MFKTCFLVIINACVPLLFACCYLNSNVRTQTMENNKKEEQQRKNNKEQGDNTHIRRISTNTNTSHVIQTIEITRKREE